MESENSMTQFYRMIWVSWVITLTILGGALSVQAADTVEPFELGATDFELYSGVDGVGCGIGCDEDEKAVFGEMVLGYGLLERLSGYAAVTFSANEHLADGAVGGAFGIYGNILDTNHFDADLFLDFSGATGTYVMTPAFELNLDLDPQMRTFGLYLRGCLSLFGRDVSDETAVAPEFESATEIGGTLGTYLTIAERHQLLVEYHMVFRPRALADERTSEVGGVGFGYNVMLTDSFELINQVYLDLPQSGEVFAVGFYIGFVATLP